MTLSSPVVPQATVVQPWATRPDVGAPAGWGGRPCLMTPPDIDAVIVDATGEPLPLLAHLTDERRMSWKKFELPATFAETDAGPATDHVALRLRQANGAGFSVRVTLEGGLPRNAHDATPGTDDMDQPPDPWRRATGLAEALYDQHIDLVSALYERVEQSADTFWDGPAGGVAVWPLSTVLAAWRQAAVHDEPRPALIVKLAQTLGPALREVCHAPRLQLIRQRRYQPAGRVQEVDATCLRWLARQPGYTVAEKAGARQQALGVDRIEHADTLENRIVAELMQQAAQACRRYQGEHTGNSNHPRVVAVRRFEQLLGQLRSRSPLARIRPVSGMPPPNYVLQRDPRYQPLWKAYVMLLKQSLQRHDAWRWRHRVWAEACVLALLATLGDIEPNAAAMRSNVLLRNEQIVGRLIDHRTAIGRWEIRNSHDPTDTDNHGRRVHLVERHHFEAYRACASLPQQLCYLCPDAVIVCHDGERPDKSPKRILAVWAMFDFDLDADQLHARCKDLDTALRLIRCDSDLRGVLIQPKLTDARNRAKFDRVETMRCQAYRLPLPLQSQSSVFDHLMRQTLDLL